MEGLKCTLNEKEIKTVEDWANGSKTDENCPPCLMAPLASMYLGTLREANENELAERLEKVFEDGDLLTIARNLDSIKGDVGEPLRKELRELDCFAQVHKQDAL